MRSLRDKIRRNSASFRALPDYLIVGAQKCGTTSLYKYLIQHPSVLPFVPIGHRRKEVRYFSNYYDYGLDWYKAHFPSLPYTRLIQGLTRRSMITGESTPSYLFNPHAPRRIRDLIPHAKLIVLLRNPIDRAYSHYQHVVRLGNEELDFERALDAEPERLAGEYEKMLADEHYVSFERGYHSYLTRGIYVDQLEVYFDVFAQDQILILNSEQFFADPETHLGKVAAFLDLPKQDLPYKEQNTGTYEDMPAATRARLADYFRPHNRRLYDLIGEEYAWD